MSDGCIRITFSIGEYEPEKQKLIKDIREIVKKERRTMTGVILEALAMYNESKTETIERAATRIMQETIAMEHVNE
jgi:hypothetical protein